MKVLKVKRKQFEDGLLKFRIDSTYLESVGRNPSVKEMRKHWGKYTDPSLYVLYPLANNAFLANVSTSSFNSTPE